VEGVALPTPNPRILFIGEPLKEYIATLEPDDSLSGQTFLGFAGDLVPNMASYTRRAATRLGATCAIDVLTAVGTGDDALSTEILADLKLHSLGIHPDTKRLSGKHLGIVINLKDASGAPAREKVRLDRRNSAFRELLSGSTEADLARMTEGYSHIVVSGTSLACMLDRAHLLALLVSARSANPSVQIIVCTNLRASNWQMPDRDDPSGLLPSDVAWRHKARRWLDAAIGLADMVFANFGDERELRGYETPHGAIDGLRALNPHAEIIVTNDASPILVSYAARDEAHLDTLGVPPVNAVADTVGAGDAFAGTYLAARLARRSSHAAAECALAIATQVVTFDGALPRHGISLVFDPVLFGTPHDTRRT
jgi:2-dehydro-3-deoxygluconokinase